MKKYVFFVILTLTVLFCFAACGKNKSVYTDPSAYSEYASESESEAAVSESKQAVEIVEDMTKTEKKLGNSSENKKLVLKKEESNATVYEVWYFGDTGKAEYKEVYYYCDDDKTYESWLEGYENGGSEVTKSDKNLRLIVLKIEDVMSASYASLYNNYVDDDDYEIM